MNHPYAKPPSNQMQIQGLEDRGFELMKNARSWMMLHRFEEWQTYIAIAREESNNTHGKASPNLCLQLLRRECKLKIPNEYAAPLARICMEEHQDIKFRLGKSKTDGFCEVKL